MEVEKGKRMRPKKKEYKEPDKKIEDIKDVLDVTCKEFQRAGYNLAIEEYEAFLPDLKELKLVIANDTFLENKFQEYQKIEISKRKLCEFIAKAIHKRITE